MFTLSIALNVLPFGTNANKGACLIADVLLGSLTLIKNESSETGALGLPA